MLKPMPKQDYLADLQARNCRNREVVETTFLPLDQAQRSWQPAPGEWSVDQCLQHLVVAFEWLSPNFIPALDKPALPDSDGIFRPSWLARRFMEKQFDPQSKYKTLKANNPAAVYNAEILTRWLAQQARLETMIEQAFTADLQTMCRVVKWVPIRYNLGDYLNFYVSHDELHIDQAQRALTAYGKRTTVG
jgi:hypothetical protein